MSDDRIPVEEALARGYRWAKFGYDHKLNTPVIGSLRMLRPFLPCGVSPKMLEEAERLVEGDMDYGPAGDIPMARSGEPGGMA